jgi:hypothetical protein
MLTRGGTNFYGPWVNSVLEALSENAAISWIYLQPKNAHRDMTEILCSDDADIAMHPMLIGSMDRQCGVVSSFGLFRSRDRRRCSHTAGAPYSPRSHRSHGYVRLTVFYSRLGMMLMERGRRRHTKTAMSGQLDVPDDVHISIYILYITFGLFTMLILSVYTAVGFVPAQSSRPTGY